MKKNTFKNGKKIKKVNVVPQTTNLEKKGEINKMKKSKVKSLIVATGATIKDHKEGLKTICMIVMMVIIIVLLMRKPQTTVEYQEVPVEVEVVKEVPVEVQVPAEDNNVRN